MPIDNTIFFNLNQGIEGLAQSPSQGKGLEALPQSQQVLPSSSLFTGNQVQDVSWMQAASQWEKAIQSFVMPNISSSVLLPSELKWRLHKLKNKVDTMARKEKSDTLRALSDALQDDANLQEILHLYRAALMRA